VLSKRSTSLCSISKSRPPVAIETDCAGSGSGLTLLVEKRNIEERLFGLGEHVLADDAEDGLCAGFGLSSFPVLFFM